MGPWAAAEVEAGEEDITADGGRADGGAYFVYCADTVVLSQPAFNCLVGCGVARR